MYHTVPCTCPSDHCRRGMGTNTKFKPGTSPLIFQIPADIGFEFALFADYPGVEVFGRLHRAIPADGGLRTAQSDCRHKPS